MLPFYWLLHDFGGNCTNRKARYSDTLIRDKVHVPLVSDDELNIISSACHSVKFHFDETILFRSPRKHSKMVEKSGFLFLKSV